MHNEHIHECVVSCWECRHACQETLFTHCLPIGGIHMDERHVKLMIDCIQICQLAADCMTRGSSLHPSVCDLCAEACEACAKACEQIGDEAMMRCVKTCQQCAKMCRSMKEDRQAA